MIAVKAIPLTSVTGLEEKFVEVEQQIVESRNPIATTSEAGIVKASDEIAVAADGTMSVVAVPIVKITDLEDRLTNIEQLLVGGVHYKGSVTTVEELPADAKQGDLYEISADGSEWCFNGEQWFEYGTTHFKPVEGNGIQIEDSTIGIRLSPVEGNILSIAEDGGLFAPDCGFTDMDRVVIDTMSMIYASKEELEEAIARAIADNQIVWEDMTGVTGVAKIGNTYYASVGAAIAAAKEGDTVNISAGTYEKIEFTKATAPNITIVGDGDVYVKKVRLVETTNYSAPYGLKLKNITFNGEGISAAYDEINNLSVVGCTFTNGAVIHINGDCVTDGLIVDGCVFEATDSTVNAKEKTAILIQGSSKNIVISDNHISDCEHNAVQIPGLAGSAFISTNTISGTGSRPIRISTKDGAAFAITNNIISDVNTNATEAEENNGEIIKISGVVTDGIVTGNTCDGVGIVFSGGLGKVQE